MLLVCLGVFIVLQTLVSFGNTVNHLCARCSGTVSNNSLVGQNCSNTGNTSVVDRCCVQNTSYGHIVIGYFIAEILLVLWHCLLVD